MSKGSAFPMLKSTIRELLLDALFLGFSRGTESGGSNGGTSEEHPEDRFIHPALSCV